MCRLVEGMRARLQNMCWGPWLKGRKFEEHPQLYRDEGDPDNIGLLRNRHPRRSSDNLQQRQLTEYPSPMQRMGNSHADEVLFLYRNSPTCGGPHVVSQASLEISRHLVGTVYLWDMYLDLGTTLLDLS